MDNELYSRLVTKLLEIPGMHNYDVRTSLILNIPNYQHLARNNSDTRADVTFIVNGLAGMYSLEGKWGLSTFIGNALERVSGITLSTDLQKLRHLLEAEQSAEEQPSEVYEEPEKKETPPNNVHEEPEKKEGQSSDAHSTLLQQVQIYHSQIADTQKLLLKAQEPLDTACKLFKAGKGIRQDQCDKAISYIYNLRAPLLQAHSLYDKAPYFRGAFFLLSFHVKVVLNDIDDQIDELTSNLRKFRDNCPVSLVVAQVYQPDNEREKIENDRKKISEQLNTLLEALKEISTMLHKFLQNQPAT